MERDAIERLAIDSASGELNDDAEALLREYLHEHAEANRWAEEVLWVCEQTEAAVRAKTRDGRANLERGAFEGKPVSQGRWPPLARWAAVVLFAALVGFGVGNRRKSDTMRGRVLPHYASVPKQAQTVSDLKDRHAGTFWGGKVLAMLESRTAQRYETDLRSIGSWDKYRQHIKEKNHE